MYSRAYLSAHNHHQTNNSARQPNRKLSCNHGDRQPPKYNNHIGRPINHLVRQVGIFGQWNPWSLDRPDTFLESKPHTALLISKSPELGDRPEVIDANSASDMVVVNNALDSPHKTHQNLSPAPPEGTQTKASKGQRARGQRFQQNQVPISEVRQTERRYGMGGSGATSVASSIADHESEKANDKPGVPLLKLPAIVTSESEKAKILKQQLHGSHRLVSGTEQLFAC